jgi:serine/threonine-protein kinase
VSGDADLEKHAQRRIGLVLKEKYKLERVLGIGGMAVVYVATHRNQKTFAVKMLLPELSIREDIKNRFLREGYAANSVKHPGVVAVMDDDVAEDGSAFLVMELLEGLGVETIWERTDHKLPVQVVVAVAQQLLDVLASAHANGIIHRDLKPANLFVTNEGQLKVLDFGIARVRDAAVTNAGATGTGTLLGTPSFMPPEQAMGKHTEIDARSDIWAVGATMFTLLSGRPVHDGETTTEVLVRAASKPAESIHLAIEGLPSSVSELVDRALAFDKTVRFQTAAEMRDALAALRMGTPRDVLLTALTEAEEKAPASKFDPFGATKADEPVQPNAKTEMLPATGAAPAKVISRAASKAAPPIVAATSTAGSVAPASVREHHELPQTRPMRLVGIAAGVLAVVAIGLYVSHVVFEKKGLAQTNADVVRCLVGDPLKADEAASLRIHRIRLAAIGTPPTPGEVPWPRRCSDLTIGFAHALEEDGHKDALRDSATQLGQVLAAYESVTSGTDISEVVDTFFRANAMQLLGPLPPSSFKAPPAPIDGPVVDKLDPKTIFEKPIALPHLSMRPDLDVAIAFWVNETGQMCSFRPKENALHCRIVSGLAHKGLHLLGTNEDGAASFLFLGARGKEGIYRSENGARVEDLAPAEIFGATAWKNGSLDLLEFKNGPSPEMLLHHIVSDGKVMESQAEDKPGSGIAHASALFWDWLVYRENPNGDWHLFTRHLENGTLGAAEDLGHVPDPVGIKVDDAPLNACRGAAVIAVRSRAKDKQAIALHSGGKWGAPMEFDGAEGALSCGKAAAFVTSRGQTGLVQTKCAAQGCVKETSPLKTLMDINRTPAEGHFAIGTLDEKVAMVWYAGAAGGLRARVAPVKTIDEAKDVLVFDDHIEGGKFTPKSTFKGFRLLSAAGAALLLVETTAGVFVNSIEENGTIVPVKILP